MKLLQKLLWIVAAGLLAQTAIAGGPLDNPKNPLGDLQAQLDHDRDGSARHLRHRASIAKSKA